jgi:uncharacterized protein (TIGR02246 family)
MKNPFLVLTVIGLSCSAQHDPTKKPEVTPAEQATAIKGDEEAIGNIVEDWKNAHNRGDPSSVASLYTEDGYYLSAYILAHGSKAIQAYWLRSVIVGGHIDLIEPRTIFRSGDLGYIVGTYQATNAGVTVDGRLLIVVKNVRGNWLIAAQETVVRDQP